MLLYDAGNDLSLKTMKEIVIYMYAVIIVNICYVMTPKTRENNNPSTLWKFSKKPLTWLVCAVFS